MNKCIDYVMKKQNKIAKDFIDSKNEVHLNEDPSFLDELSDVFDLRLWNLNRFNPENENSDTIFEEEREEMVNKLLSNKIFFTGLGDSVGADFYDLLTIIYENVKDGSEILFEAAKKNHIVDQWSFLVKFIPQIDEIKFRQFLRAVKRAVLAPNSQAGCERANSLYNFSKSKNAASMSIKMIQARLRIKINSPPLSKFNPIPVRKYWIMKGHQLAETISERKLVIERIKKEEEAKYDCKIFD